MLRTVTREITTLSILALTGLLSWHGSITGGEALGVIAFVIGGKVGSTVPTAAE